MKNKWQIGLFLLLFCVLSNTELQAQLVYEVNLNDRADDQFKVTLHVKGLKEENAIYQFASTAPGTYQVMDMGRFVHDFSVYNKKGKKLKSKQISTNQWKIENVKKAAKIQYNITETWDTKVKEHKIYLMCGSSLEKDNVLINGQTLFGFPRGMQGSSMKIKLEYPENWKVGTALNQDEEGYFLANSYDHIVDSPILLGRLTKASTKVKGVPIEIYTYSKTDKIKSDQLLNSMSEMLKAAGEFVIDFPVDRYTFLFHFEDQSAGAWEHSYSSEYIYQEQDYTPAYGAKITSTAAHEFFHVVTPLNIHSEIIEQFNFETPTPSQHLWLYEGTTEWASDMMQLRYGMMDLKKYLEEVSNKIFVDNKYFDTDYSLVKLALTSYAPEGQKQYGNIYYRGALVAGLLDIRLLELSGGKKGLRELVYELSKKYGKNKAFPEKDMFSVITEMTYPEIGDFFEKYVKNTNPLPYKEYYAKIGVKYYPVKKIKQPSLGFKPAPLEGKIAVASVQEKTLDLEEGDIIEKWNGTPLTFENANELLEDFLSQKEGTTGTLYIRRGEEEKEVKITLLKIEKEQPYVLEIDPKATDAEKKLRKIWQKNL